MKNEKNKEDVKVFSLASANKTLKVKSEFNTVPLKDFTAIEMDLLFTIMTQMRDKGLQKVKFYFEDLKELSKYSYVGSLTKFAEDLDRVYSKLISLNVKIGTDRKWTRFVFFTDYTIDMDSQTITVSSHPNYAHLINDYLKASYTQIELEEIVSLSSKYSKGLYRLLKQFRSTGFYKVSVEDFRKLLDIPETYVFSNIRQKVLKPAFKELKEYFEDFKVKEIKAKGKRGVGSLEFSFVPEKNNTFEKDKYKNRNNFLTDVEYKKQQEKIAEDFWKNQ